MEGSRLYRYSTDPMHGMMTILVDTVVGLSMGEGVRVNALPPHYQLPRRPLAALSPLPHQHWLPDV